MKYDFNYIINTDPNQVGPPTVGPFPSEEEARDYAKARNHTNYTVALIAPPVGGENWRSYVEPLDETVIRVAGEVMDYMLDLFKIPRIDREELRRILAPLAELERP